MTFNTENERKLRRKISIVLNLIINGWPSIPTKQEKRKLKKLVMAVLNLIINGWPSIHQL